MYSVTTHTTYLSPESTLCFCHSAVLFAQNPSKDTGMFMCVLFLAETLIYGIQMNVCAERAEIWVSSSCQLCSC